MSKKIVCTRGVCGGAPRIDETRLTCSNVVLALAANRWSIDDYLKYYPELESSDVEEALRYCVEMRCLDNQPDSYCQGCILDHRKTEDPSFFIENIDDLRSYLKSGKDIGQAFLGSRQDYADEAPEKVWELAEQIRRDHLKE